MELKNPEYKNWISELKQQIQQSQIKAAIKVNSALIEMYWDLGREISEKHFENTYGSGFFKQLSLDLKKEIPNIKGFSESNLKFCKRFYLFYNQPSENRQQLVNDLKQKLYLIPWGHQIILLTKCKTIKEAYFYIDKTIENGWSRNILINMISAGLLESQGRAITNFSRTLPEYESGLIQETLKDPYNFEFLTLTETFKEKELENSLIENISRFLIELGNGFAFVGKQIEIKVGKKSYYIDLLFYHIRLKRYVVIELKTGSFEPEFAGKLNFYVTAVDQQLREDSDNSTIGLIICKDKDEIIAEYSLTDLYKPLGISSYELKKVLPEDFKSLLPSIEEVEEELRKFYL